MKSLGSFGAWALCVLMPTLVACVGPTTPFGAVDSFGLEEAKPKADRQVAGEKTVSKSIMDYRRPMIHFSPKRQFLHDRSAFEIQITDAQSIPDHFGFKIYHNKRDVTQKFLGMSKIEKAEDNKSISFKFKDLRLRVDEINDIEVVYEKDGGESYSAEFLPPTCSLFDKQPITRFHGFKGKEKYLPLIEDIALRSQSNPSFMAGMVAQESGFNPSAVSWAKAIGLTQITPLAEQELMRRQKVSGVWPRFPGINKMNYLKLKAKIVTGEIDKKKEWRLNPRYSIEGGATYINYLKKYWDLPNNKKIVQSLPGDFDMNLSQVILASYNSGAARVKAAIVSHGSSWKNHKKLKEARKYVNKVSSYCYHFSTEESS